MARRPACRGRWRRRRVAVFVQARAVPPSAVRAHGAIGAGTASPENGRRPGKRARRDACRSPPPSSPCTSSEAARRRPRCATTPKPPKPLSRTSARKSACGSSSARCPLLEQAPDGPERNALQITDRERFTASPPPECLARAAKQRARSSERTRCSTKHRSIRCGLACCTDSDSCFRLRAEYAEALAVADRAEALGSTTNDPAASVDRVHRAWAGRSASGSIAGRTDMAGARARPVRAAGRGSRRIPGGSAGRAARDARHPAPSSRLGGACARLRAARTMPALAIGDGRWRGSSQSGTARCSRCGWATPSA